MKKISILGAALLAVVAFAAPAAAAPTDSGSISCSTVAVVESSASGHVYVKPPGPNEANLYQGNSTGLVDRTTYEGDPDDGGWSVSGAAVDTVATTARCSALRW